MVASNVQKHSRGNAKNNNEAMAGCLNELAAIVAFLLPSCVLSLGGALQCVRKTS